MPVSTDMLDGGVAVVTLSPAASSNTFSPDHFDPFLSCLQEAMDNLSCRSIVITGSGRFFSSGGNMDDFSDAIENGNIGRRVQELSLIHI